MQALSYTLWSDCNCGQMLLTYDLQHMGLKLRWSDVWQGRFERTSVETMDLNLDLVGFPLRLSCHWEEYLTYLVFQTKVLPHTWYIQAFWTGWQDVKQYVANINKKLSYRRETSLQPV